MSIVIKAKGILDVEQKKILPDAYLIVEGETISAVGAQAEMPVLLPDDPVYDFPEDTILPGLVNSHAHLCMLSQGRSREELKDLEREVWVLAAAQNARKELMSGVTTLRDCGSHENAMFGFRKAMEMGLVDSPRLFVSGQPLTITGGHSHFWGLEVDGADEVMRGARLQFKQGADFIKMMGTGGSSTRTLPWYASFSVPEIAAAVDTAHRVGKTVAIHCRGIPGIQDALDGGVDQIEHACFELPGGELRFDARLADEIARKEVIVTPTIQLYRDLLTAFSEKKESGTMTAAEEKRFEGMPMAVEVKLKSMAGFLSAGVKCVAGNDAGLPYTGFGCLWQELEAMVDGGMTPMQALESATLTPAQAMGLEKAIGSLKPGKQADLIAVKGDPSTDIRTLSRVIFVMQAGKLVKAPHLAGPQRSDHKLATGGSKPPVNSGY